VTHNHSKKEKLLYKQYLPYISVTLFILLLFLMLRFLQPNELRISQSILFTDIYKDLPTVEIAGFDQGENWRGDYTHDSIRTLDGISAINIFSSKKTNSITLDKPLNLNNYKTIFAYFYIDKEETVDTIDKLRIGFTSGEKTSYFTVFKFNTGWNLASMEKKDFSDQSINWQSIRRVSIDLTPVADQTPQVTFDRIWTQQPIPNKRDLLSDANGYMSMKTVGKKTFLHIASPVLTHTRLQKPIQKNEFMYTVTFAPLKLGQFVISFQTDESAHNGYFFSAEGQDMDSYRLYKKINGVETTLIKGTFEKNIFEKEAYVSLRVQKTKKKIGVSVHMGGNKYIPLLTTYDPTFSKGYCGVLHKGSYLIDTIEVRE